MKLPTQATGLLIAHRGASHDAPENTLASAVLGWKQGADGVECDVHVSRDGLLAVMHDESLTRTARVEGLVEELTLAELKQLDVGSWRGEGFSGERIPSLLELLQTVPSGKLALVEIKAKRDVSLQLEGAIAAANLSAEQVVLIGFDFEVMRALKAKLPQYPALWLVGGTDLRERAEVDAALDAMVARVQAAGLDGLDIWQGWPIDGAFMEKMHAANLKLAVYTVNEPSMARSLIAAGVDLITTDRPGFIREQLLDI